MMKKSRAQIDYLFDGFLILLVLLPLPFGANRPWASDLFAVLISCLSLGLALILCRAPELWPRGAPNRRLTVSMIFIGLVALWAWLQTVSWMPEAWHHPVWQSAAELPGSPAGAISVDPRLMPESLARLLSYVMCFFVAFIAARDNGRAQRILIVFTGAALFYAIYGLIVQTSGTNTILWYKKWAYQGFLTSTFVNKNSCAAYLGLGLIASLALGWQRLQNMQHLIRDFRPRDAVYPVMIIVLLSALLLTGSRAGIASSLAGCIAFMLALAVNLRAGRKVRMAMLAAASVLLIIVLSCNGLSDRMAPQQVASDAELRGHAYALILQAIADNPWRGFRARCFRSRLPALPRCRRADVAFARA